MQQWCLTAPMVASHALPSGCVCAERSQFDCYDFANPAGLSDGLASISQAGAFDVVNSSCDLSPISNSCDSWQHCPS